MFAKVLVMGHGEMAARVARTCRRVGSDTVGLYCEGEENSPHISACDEGHLVPKIAGDTKPHRNVKTIAQAIVERDVTAVHPGYVKNAKDLSLLRSLEKQNIAFVGPRSEQAVLFRDRSEMQMQAALAGIRTLPHGIFLGDANYDEIVQRVGTPFSVVPPIGFGEGISLRICHSVHDWNNVAETLESNREWFVCRAPDRARRVSVYTLSDGRGHFAALAEVETSVRKDGVVLLAESPSPAVTTQRNQEAVRGALFAAATDFVRHLRYRGVGVVHFAIDARGRTFFTGFSPGLMPEHSVVEMCTNLDLVELQLLLACDEDIPRKIWGVEASGHAVFSAIEAASDPQSHHVFSGRVEELRWPPSPAGKVRIETGLQAQLPLSKHHSASVAGVTTYAATRHEAVLLLDRVISETKIAPLVTNLRLLRKIVNHESFRANQYDDAFVERMGSMSSMAP